MQKFKLLFQPVDRKQTGAHIWEKFLATGTERPINVPDLTWRKTQRLVLPPEGKEVGADAFDAAEREILNLVVDNFYAEYRKREVAGGAAGGAEKVKKGGGGGDDGAATGRRRGGGDGSGPTRRRRRREKAAAASSHDASGLAAGELVKVSQ